MMNIQNGIGSMEDIGKLCQFQGCLTVQAITAMQVVLVGIQIVQKGMYL